MTFTCCSLMHVSSLLSIICVDSGVAIQCRVTTENPERDFAPDTGTISLYRHSAGAGVRMDGIGYTGLKITPFFDSMIVKYTTRGANFPEAVARMKRTLQECRIRGVKTNIPFLLNVLSNPIFETGIVTTSFIDENPDLKKTSTSTWDFASEEQADPRKLFATERLVRYIANLAVNGHPPELGADETKIEKSSTGKVLPPKMPAEDVVTSNTREGGMRGILLEEGPAGYAKFVREHEGLLVTDTTWRDAHQSLFATRMRTQELLKCAEFTNKALANAFSMESKYRSKHQIYICSYVVPFILCSLACLSLTLVWGGATYDVAMRFLHECPWERLEKLREAVPDVPFQMLLRGANAVGYTNYPDNVGTYCSIIVLKGAFRIVRTDKFFLSLYCDSLILLRSVQVLRRGAQVWYRYLSCV